MKIVNFKDELENIPGDLVLNRSNAFPWITRISDEEYLTFRTAPTHFPNKKSKDIILKRKVGEKKWNLERIFSINEDLREPRITRLGGKPLFFYSYSLRGLAMFKPAQIMFSEKTADNWTEGKQIFKNGFIMYSLKEIGGILYMTCYTKVYGSECYFLKSKDGYKWEDVFPDKHLEKYLTCETDFIFKDDYWYFVCRNEFGKFDKYGSEIYKFDKNGDLVKHFHSELKFDGPLLFEKDDEILLVARKNLSNNGEFLLPIKPVRFFGYWISNLYYWLTPKKTAIWKLDKETLETEFDTDLPSNGDTSYASVLQSGGKIKIFYYSSPLKPIKNWVGGQLGKTSIYSVEVI